MSQRLCIVLHFLTYCSEVPYLLFRSQSSNSYSKEGVQHTSSLRTNISSYRVSIVCILNHFILVLIYHLIKSFAFFPLYEYFFFFFFL